MVPAEVSRREGLAGLRELVLDVLGRTRGKTFLNEVLQQAFNRRGFPSALRAAAVELASGVVRRRITLDHLIARFADRPIGKIDRRLLDVLRIAVYEILFVEKVPARASVSEAVALTKKRVRTEFAGFTNAVLRELTRALKPGVPVTSDRDLFPDPDTEAVGYLSTAGGMPGWLVERWLRNFNRDEVFQLVNASNVKPPVTVRVNTLKTRRETLAEALREVGVGTSPGSAEESLRIDSAVALTSLDLFKAGAFYIQDESAMLAARMLSPRAGERVLDLCAAPGGKTTHLAELSSDRAEIVAVDSSESRLRRVEENARRLGIRSIRTCTGDAREPDETLVQAFDAVLADVPCSNTGVLRRRVEARHRLREDAVTGLAGVQAELLRAALRASRPGGRVVYSTCSIEPEENRELVRDVLDDAPDWKLDAETTCLPRVNGPDGGYAARLISA